MKQSVPYIIGIGELQRQAATVFKKLSSKHGEGFVVSHNEPKAVLMTLERYEKLSRLEQAKRLEEHEVLALIAEGDHEFETGKTRTAKSLKEFV